MIIHGGVVGFEKLEQLNHLRIKNDRSAAVFADLRNSQNSEAIASHQGGAYLTIN